MKIKWTIFTLSVLLAISYSEAINISGTVKTSGGAGLAGVVVKLGKACIKTTTGSDGSFTLTDVTGMMNHSQRMTFSNNRPFVLKGNTIHFSTAERVKIKLMAYGCNGRLLRSLDYVVSEGNVSMTLPEFRGGVQIYRVFIDEKPYTFSTVFAMATNRSTATSGGVPGRATQSKTTIQIDDALMFIKPGYQYNRVAITKSDTTNLQVTMTPLDTGTMTDAEGNVYKTVRIGNQIWMAENLRSTKFTDGSNIGNGCMFYNNTNDAAAKKKWGALYNDAASKGKLAPTGWRVPSSADWDALIKYLISQGYNYDGTTKDDKTAKAMAATTDWDTTSETGGIGNDLSLNNASGFTALPAGWRFWDNKFEKQLTGAYWWIAGSSSANVCDLWWNSMALDRYSTIFIYCSIRLVRNA